MGRFSRADNRCPRCRLHTERCICGKIPRLETRTKLALVQHHRETIKTTATGPLALLCLPNHELFVHGGRDGAEDSSSRVSLTHLHDEGRRVLLLYPTDEARPLTPELVAEDPRPITLIVPDGNWGQASRISRRVDGMAAAESVFLPAGRPTEWGLRQEPHLGGLATFEAIARSLGIIEGPEIEQALMQVFSRMVEATIEMRGVAPQIHKPPTTAREPLPILYRDAHMVAVNKPSGVLVHRGWANDDEPALQRLRDQIGQRVHPVHRLDRATSGTLLFALDSSTARALAEAFENDRVRKRYLALSRGRRVEEMRVDHPLAKDKGGEKRPAVTDVRLLGHHDRYGLYEAVPHTGRTHQIRRHFKHLHQPLIGDTRYGTGAHNRFFRDTYDWHRLALHCESLSLTHPHTGESLHIVAPLPAEFCRLLERLDLLDAVGA